MTEQQKKSVMIAVGLVLLAGVFYALFGRSSGAGAAGGGASDAVTMVCQNPACKNEFKITPAEAQDYLRRHPGDSIHCPKCKGTDVVEAGKAERGSRVEGAGRGKR